MTLKPLHLFFVFISLLNLSPLFVSSQTNSLTKADSLKTALANIKDACHEPCLGDTTKVNLLNKLGWELMHQNPDTSILLGKKALELAERLPSHLGELVPISREGPGVRFIANTNSNLGVYYWLKDDYPLSLSHHFKALEIRKELNDQKGIAASLGNIGIVYKKQGNYPKALKHYFEALIIDKELGDKAGMAADLGNIGIVYSDQADAAKSRQDIANSDSLYAKALKHYFDALEIAKELGNKNGIARQLGNIGSVYYEQANAAKSPDMNRGSDSLYAKALKHYFEALEIGKELGNKNGIARHLGNIGIVYSEQASAAKSRQDITVSDSLYAKALKHYFSALVIDKELGNKNGMAIRLGNIGSLYTQTGRFKEAEAYLDSALAIDLEIGRISGQMHRYEALSHLYDTTARYQLAYQHYKKYSDAKDSLFNEEKSKDIGRLEQNHQFELEEMERIQKELESSRQEAAAVGRRNLLQYSGIFLVLVFLFLGIFLLARRFRKIKDNVIAKPEYQAVMPNKTVISSDSEKSPEGSFSQGIPPYSRNDSFIYRNDSYINDVKIFEAALFISFLILFEFILVLIDPYLEILAGGEPVLKLLSNAVIAGVIFPLHKILEAKLRASVMKGESRESEDGSRKMKENSGSKTLLLIVGFALISLFNISFSGKTDSLKTAISNTKEACPEPCLGDTTKVKLLNKLGWELMYQNPDTSILLGKQALEIAIKNSNQNGIANTNSNLGVYYYLKGDYSLSLSHHFKALEIRKQLNDKKGIAVSLGNIGLVYEVQGNYPKALKHYFEALVIGKELGDKNRIAIQLGNIGIVYKEQADAANSRQDITNSDSLYTKALKHFFEALVIDKELGNKNGIARHLSNIGAVYCEQANAAKSRQDIANSDSLYAKALKHYFSALEIAKELGNKNGMAILLGNIGIVYADQADAAKSRQDIAGSDSLYAKALKHYFEAMEIDKELGRKSGIAIRLGNIGSLYTQTGRFKEAEVYLDSALVICDNIGTLNITMQVEELFSHLYDTTARYQLAYQHYKKYCTAKDSLFNEEKSKEIGRLEQNHQFELEELEREIMEKEKSRQEAEAAGRRNLLQYSAIFLILFFMFGLVFFIGRIPLPEWLIELSTFVPFMILFEFILMLIEPYIDNYSGGEPAFKLLINAVCAAIIFPIHNFFEKKLKARIYQIKKQKEEKYAEEFRKEVDKYGNR